MSRRLVFGPLLPAAALVAALIWLGPAGGDPAHSAPAAEPALPCLDKKGRAYKPKVEPKRCVHFKLGAGRGAGLDLRGLVWSGWATGKARGAGVDCAFDPDGCRVSPATVRAYRIRIRCGRRMYTRLQARSSFGTTTIKTRACLGRA